jgi:hypothetical protein
MKFKVAILLALLTSLWASPSAAAVVLVSTEAGIAADGLIDWGALGPDATQIAQPFTTPVPGVGGLTATVSQAGASNFERRDQGIGWAGNFAPGEKLLWSLGANGPMTFLFNSLIQGFGLQIQANFFGPFTAELEAFDASNLSLGSVTLAGNSTADGDDSAIFIGVLSSAIDIQSVVVKVPVAFSNPQDFAINGPRIQTEGTVVPEPASMALAGAALLGLGCLRRKSGKRQVSS